MRFTRTRRYALLRHAVKSLLPLRLRGREYMPVDDRPTVEEAETVALEWPAGVRKPYVGLVPDVNCYPYWTKYRRFLESNDIPHEIYNIHRSTWLRDAQRFDMVVWRPMSLPQELEECRRKLFMLEQQLGTLCSPSFAEACLNEDKIMQFECLKLHGLPVIDTLVSHQMSEIMDHIASCRYPLVWKLTTGSGSFGVELLRHRRTAERWVRQVFSSAGRRTYWPYLSQKDYVYLQQLVPNASYDVRVIVIGPTVFGYYRDVPRGEFRASGMKALRYDLPSAQAVHLARRVAAALDLPHVAVDMLADGATGELQIIELSMFWMIDVLGELRQEGVSGAFVFDGDGDEYHFQPMRVWPQELALKRVMETRWIARENRSQGKPGLREAECPEPHGARSMDAGVHDSAHR